MIKVLQNKNNRTVDLEYASVEVNQRGDRNDTGQEKTCPVHIIPDFQFEM